MITDEDPSPDSPRVPAGVKEFRYLAGLAGSMANGYLDRRVRPVSDDSLEALIIASQRVYGATVTVGLRCPWKRDGAWKCLDASKHWRQRLWDDIDNSRNTRDCGRDQSVWLRCAAAEFISALEVVVHEDNDWRS